MCGHCEHHVPVLENDNSVLFISGDCLILQDKTRPVITDLEDGMVQYQSKWFHVDRCPVCGRILGDS